MREENEEEGKKRDLPDQCQTTSYAPDSVCIEAEILTVIIYDI